MVIASFNPSFPSYEKISEILGISRDRVRISIKNLKENNVIAVNKTGRCNSYVTFWNRLPESPIDDGIGCQKALRRLPESLGIGCQKASNKNKEKEQYKNKRKEISDEIGKELSFSELMHMIKINKSMADQEKKQMEVEIVHQ